MKVYYYLKENNVIQPIALKHEDGTVAYYNTTLGRIDFSGTKKGDKIKMFNGEKYEGVCDVIGVYNVNGSIQLELGDPSFEPDSPYLGERLANDLNHYKNRAEEYEKSRDEYLRNAEDSDEAAKKMRAKVDEIIHLAGIHNIKL